MSFDLLTDKYICVAFKIEPGERGDTRELRVRFPEETPIMVRSSVSNPEYTEVDFIFPATTYGIVVKEPIDEVSRKLKMWVRLDNAPESEKQETGKGA